MIKKLWCDFLYNADLSTNREVNIAVRERTSIAEAIEFAELEIN